MVKAIWRNKVIAESDNYEILDSNYYFPPESLNKEYIVESNMQTTCPYKGLASYYDVVVDGEVNKDAAWYYPDPKPIVKKIKNYIAFWKGIEIKE